MFLWWFEQEQSPLPMRNRQKTDQKELRKSLWKLVLLYVLLPSNEVCFLPPAAEFPITVPNSLEKVANRLKRFPCKSCFCNFAHCCGHRALFLHKNCQRFQESEHLLVADKLDLHMLRASQNLGRIVHSAEEKTFKNVNMLIFCRSCVQNRTFLYLI